jgi:spore germination cell wall hydrolase CwlJ-like protein
LALKKGNQMKKFMVQQSNVLATWSSRIIKSAALFVVAFAVWTVCESRLNTLKNDRAASMAGYVSAEDKLKQLDCLTRNIYWEAASEPFEGKVAVAQVTLNRVEDGRFANTVCGVVYQKNVFYERVVCQFSWFCEGNHKIRAIHKPMWQESELVAKKVLLENFRLPGMKNALYYHADYVNPNWRKPKIDQIGRHIFYGEKI